MGFSLSLSLPKLKLEAAEEEEAETEKPPESSPTPLCQYVALHESHFPFCCFSACTLNRQRRLHRSKNEVSITQSSGIVCSLRAWSAPSRVFAVLLSAAAERERRETGEERGLDTRERAELNHSSERERITDELQIQTAWPELTEHNIFSAISIPR